MDVHYVQLVACHVSYEHLHLDCFKMLTPPVASWFYVYEEQQQTLQATQLLRLNCKYKPQFALTH